MRIFLFIFAISIQSCLYAQVPIWETHSFDQNLDVAFMSTDDLGFLWPCSKTELFRFNGQELDSRFNLVDDEFTAFRKKKDGDFCLATKKGACYLFDPTTGKIKLNLENTTLENLTDLYLVDNENYLLISYGAGALLSKNGQQHTLTKDSELVSNELYDLAFIDNKYYIGSDQGIQIIDVTDQAPKFEALTLEDGLPDLVITKLENSEHQLWFTDYNNHVGTITAENKIKLLPKVDQAKIHNLRINNSRIFVSTDHGLFQFDNDEWIKKYPEDGREKVETFVIDNENNLWFKSAKNTLEKGDLTIEKQLSLDGNVRAIYKSGKTFLIGKDSGLYQYSGKKRDKINDKNITCIIEHQGFILVGTFSDGILLYDKNLNLIDQKESWLKIPSQSVLTIYSVKDEIYVSSLSGIMKFKLNREKLQELGSINESLGRDYIYTIHWTGEEFVFGTDRNGLIVWNPKSDQVEKIKSFESKEKIGSVYSITQDAEGTIWFTSSQKGIGVKGVNGIEFIQNVENITDEYTTISRLSDDQIIMVRSSSIDVLNPETLELRNYNQNSDSKIESEYLNAIVHDKNRSYILHSNDILSYTPTATIKDEPSVVIDQVMVNLSPIDDRNNFKEHECNIEFNYTGLWLSDPNSLIYRYKLEGFDNDWRETRNTTVAFPKLRPGEYVFKIQCSKNKNFANAAIMEYPFQISTHWYNSLYARILALVAGLVLIWLFYKNRERQKNEKLALEKLKIENQINSLKSQLNPHFLFNSFNTLIGLIEEDKPKSIEFVERMSDFYRAMLELGKLDLVPLEKEIELLDQYMSILKTRFSGQLNFTTEYDNLEDFILPPFTLQMLIENAVKHNVLSSKKPLDIRVTKKDNELSVWNRKNLLLSSSKGTKTGLENIKRRFNLSGLLEPIILDRDDSFEVKLKLKKL